MKTSEGAESAYRVIESAFRAGDTARAEKLVLDFSDKGTPHAFWLAKSFLVLGDIYVQKGDMFQARATYQSIVDGYTPPMTESLRKRKRKSRNSINDMKRSAILSLMFIAGMLAVPGVLNAQVEKRVEVSKAYVPSVEHATKLAVRPNMVDTAAIQPEIDYSITPLTLETQLATRPIRPATITYWEFDRPLPFYLKAGAGYPLNSALDLYVSTQNPDIGYALGYINHDGRYGRIPIRPTGTIAPCGWTIGWVSPPGNTSGVMCWRAR